MLLPLFVSLQYSEMETLPVRLSDWNFREIYTLIKGTKFDLVFHFHLTNTTAELFGSCSAHVTQQLQFPMSLANDQTVKHFEKLSILFLPVLNDYAAISNKFDGLLNIVPTLWNVQYCDNMLIITLFFHKSIRSVRSQFNILRDSLGF